MFIYFYGLFILMFGVFTKSFFNNQAPEGRALHKRQL